MIVVGVGCGPGMLTEEAARRIREARQIFTSRRALDLVREHVSPQCEVHILSDYSSLDNLPADTVVLSTGDPMLAGLGRKGSIIVPGISSLQVAAAKLGFELVRVSIVDAHGKDGMPYENLAQELDRGKVVFLLADPDLDIGMLCSNLITDGLDGRVALCEDLGYPEERIVLGSFREPPEARSRLFSVVLGEW